MLAKRSFSDLSHRSNWGKIYDDYVHSCNQVIQKKECFELGVIGNLSLPLISLLAKKSHDLVRFGVCKEIELTESIPLYKLNGMIVVDTFTVSLLPTDIFKKATLSMSFGFSNDYHPVKEVQPQSNTFRFYDVPLIIHKDFDFKVTLDIVDPFNLNLKRTVVITGSIIKADVDKELDSDTFYV
jgi:hypothetical protein